MPHEKRAQLAEHHNNRRMYDWKLRSIRWRDILRYQHWGALLLFIPAVVVTAVSHWTFQEWPVQRQALLYDATISYPAPVRETIPNTLAVAFNWICFAVAVVVIELVIFYRQHSLTTALAGILHQVWACLVNFLIIVAITEVTKPFSGRLRPDFLALCQPSNLASPGASSAQSTPLAESANSLGAINLGQPVVNCTNPDQASVRDGRLSFPSGHSSNSMSLAWYTALYMMWSLYLRLDAPFPKRLYWRSSMWARILGEVLHAAAYGFVLLTLCLSWFIGATRFWDNRHNISDIIGGFLLAIIFTTPYFVKALGLHTAMREQIDAAEPTKPDSAAAAASPAGADNSYNHGGPGPVLPVTADPATPEFPENRSYSSIGYGNSAGASPVNGVRNAPGGLGSGDVVLQMGSMPRR